MTTSFLYHIVYIPKTKTIASYNSACSYICEIVKYIILLNALGMANQ